MSYMIFPLQIGLIKSRFHYIKHHFPDFHDFLTFLVLEPRISLFYYTKNPSKKSEPVGQGLTVGTHH